MKKRLNLLTLLLAVAFGIHSLSFLGENLYDFVEGFNEGYNDARERHNKGTEDRTTALSLKIYPEKQGMIVDSVYNTKTQTWIPSRISGTTVLVEESKASKLYLTIGRLLMLPVSVLCIVVIVCFIKVILAVNKSIIFDIVNVRRLRIMGLSFIIIFLLVFIINYYHLQLARSMIEIPDYRIGGAYIYSAFSLILGILSFIVGEIFAIGLRLKEENEFTI